MIELMSIGQLIHLEIDNWPDNSNLLKYNEKQERNKIFGKKIFQFALPAVKQW